MSFTINCYEVIKWSIIIVCELIPMIGSSCIQRNQVISSTLLGIVTAMTAIFVGMMALSAFIQFEGKEYIGVIISGVITLFAMSIPFWVPQVLSNGDSE